MSGNEGTESFVPGDKPIHVTEFDQVIGLLTRIADALDVIAYAAMQDGSGEEEEEGGYTSLSDH